MFVFLFCSFCVWVCPSGFSSLFVCYFQYFSVRACLTLSPFFNLSTFQKVQGFCIDVTEEMETKTEVVCTTGVLCSSNVASKEPLYRLDILSHQACTSGLLFFSLCHVMSESMCRIEISERERGFVLACAKLIPARFFVWDTSQNLQTSKASIVFH